MNELQLTQVPATRTGMLIRKPAAEVFEAFADDLLLCSAMVRSCSE